MTKDIAQVALEICEGYLPSQLDLAAPTSLRLIASSKKFGESAVVVGNSNSSQRFYIASLTKMFVAAVLLNLIDQFSLTRSAKITNWIPELDRRFANVTIQDLLDHSSGLNDYTEDKSQLETVKRSSTLEEATLLLVPKAKIACPDQFSYSNTGYLILGLLAERISNESLRNLIHANLLKPEDLPSTSYPEQIDLSISRCWLRDQQWREVLISREEIGFSDGGLISSSADLTQWSEAIMEQRGVAKFLRPIKTHGGTVSACHYRNGLNWQKALSGHECFWHSGAGPGFRSLLIGCPETKRTFVMLTNFELIDSKNQVDQILDLVFGPAS